MRVIKTLAELLTFGFRAGLPDFSSTTNQNGKIYQTTIKYTIWPQNIPNGRKTSQTGRKISQNGR
jgi:hypothetical protein